MYVFIFLIMEEGNEEILGSPHRCNAHLLSLSTLAQSYFWDIVIIRLNCNNCYSLEVRSYEIGVLVMDPHGIRVPFDYPLCRYKEGDRPWYIDDLNDDRAILDNMKCTISPSG